MTDQPTPSTDTGASFPYQPPYAGFWRRHASNIVDGLILVLPTVIASVVPVMIYFYQVYPPMAFEGYVYLYSHDPLAPLIAYPLPVLVGVLYYSLFEARNNGATPGRMLLKTAVRNQDFSQVSFAQARQRQLLRYGLFAGALLLEALDSFDAPVKYLGLLLLFGWHLSIYLTQVFTPQRQTLYDRWSKTVVVRTAVQPAWPPWVINGCMVALWLLLTIGLTALVIFAVMAARKAY